MARTLWGIVYGTAHPHCRFQILPDDDSELQGWTVGAGHSLDDRTLEPGAKLITIPIAQGETPDQFNARVAAAICADAGVGQLVPINFAVVDGTNTVVDVKVGDPTFCPPAAGMTHVAFLAGVDMIGIGHAYNPATGAFQSPIGSSATKGPVVLPAPVTPSVPITLKSSTA